MIIGFSKHRHQSQPGWVREEKRGEERVGLRVNLHALTLNCALLCPPVHDYWCDSIDSLIKCVCVHILWIFVHVCVCVFSHFPGSPPVPPSLAKMLLNKEDRLSLCVSPLHFFFSKHTLQPANVQATWKKLCGYIYRRSLMIPLKRATVHRNGLLSVLITHTHTKPHRSHVTSVDQTFTLFPYNIFFTTFSRECISIRKKIQTTFSPSLDMKYKVRSSS